MFMIQIELFRSFSWLSSHRLAVQAIFNTRSGFFRAPALFGKGFYAPRITVQSDSGALRVTMLTLSLTARPQNKLCGSQPIASQLRFEKLLRLGRLAGTTRMVPQPRIPTSNYYLRITDGDSVFAVHTGRKGPPPWRVRAMQTAQPREGAGRRLILGGP